MDIAQQFYCQISRH